VASIIDTVANLAKRRGLVYQSGEIYGGTKSAWDYGPLGVELVTAVTVCRVHDPPLP